MQLPELLTKIPPEFIRKLNSLGNYPVYIIGVRGYYRDTMGKPGVNDRGIYDDAFFIVGPNGLFLPFNGNTDPSRHQKAVAVLQPGVYLYSQGLHGISGKSPYPALRQASDVTVLRDGSTEPVTDSISNRFWINIHKGGRNTTSSLGCQTTPPDQWDDFKFQVYTHMDEHKQKKIPYILIDVS